jgi:hypothetical protein
MSQLFDPARFDAAGLNLHAVFDLASLPAAVKAPLAGHDPRCVQLILLGHGGRRLWDAVQAAAIASPDPIDEFTLGVCRTWAAEQLPGRVCEVVYPGSHAIGLQALGELAGWHHASPFMVGVNESWGSWFAYRAVLLTDSAFAPTLPQRGSSPCVSCATSPCLAACPGDALAGGFRLESCVAYRKTPGSLCRNTCVARLACPVASQHRYTDQQLAHSYSRSMSWLERRG